MSEPLYLRQNVQVEPLFDGWYAWSHLVSPATAARNITDRHLKIMDSYIAAPNVHAAAVKNPNMAGGPFIDYKDPRVDEIAALRDRTKRERTKQIEFSAAIGELDQLLRTTANGHSLEPLYPRVPEILRGYVELTYDLNHHPSFRVIEPLLYRSEIYARDAQSIVLSVTSGDDRPFVLSTPRLPSPKSLALPWSFDDERVDALFQLKRNPAPWDRVRDQLAISEADDALARSFFTADSPERYRPYDGDGIRWRYFGHACILIEARGVSILLDPVLSYTYESDISRYTYADLPDSIDLVLITHNHQDHILFETLLQLRHKIGQIVVPRNGGGALQDPSLKLTLEAAGCPRVVELGEMETLKFNGGSITGLPFLGEHCDLAVMTKLAHLVQLGDVRLLFAADSCNVEPKVYEHIHRAIGDIDVLFLGMECNGAPLSWLYGPLLTRPLDRAMDQSRRLRGCDYMQGMAIVDQFRCREAYVYAMGQEPWLNYVMSIKYTDQSRPIIESNRLIEDCRARGIVAERLFGEKEILIERTSRHHYSSAEQTVSVAG
jgi:L-ascorbate metabolism protein UlaG (beta-lactamase superfamily)